MDGCKLKSNASPQWSRTVSELKAKREKLEEKVKVLLKEQEEEDRKDDDDTTPPDNRSYREKQIEKLEKQADRIETWLKENGERLGVRGKEIKSNMTDNESCKMFTSSGMTKVKIMDIIIPMRLILCIMTAMLKKIKCVHLQK